MACFRSVAWLCRASGCCHRAVRNPSGVRTLSRSHAIALSLGSKAFI